MKPGDTFAAFSLSAGGMVCPNCGEKTTLIIRLATGGRCPGCRDPKLNRAENLRADAARYRKTADRLSPVMDQELENIALAREKEADEWEQAQAKPL